MAKAPAADHQLMLSRARDRLSLSCAADGSGSPRLRRSPEPAARQRRARQTSDQPLSYARQGENEMRDVLIAVLNC